MGWNTEKAPSHVHVQYWSIFYHYEALAGVSSRAPTMTYLSRLVSGRLDLGGGEKLGSKYKLGGRYSLGGLQHQHGNRLLHSSTDASVDTDFLGFLRSQRDRYLWIHGERSR